MPDDDPRYGVFSGEPQTVWLTEPEADRRMKLLEKFTFTDAEGRVWDAPKDHCIDGASIPRALWTLVGSPYTGDYRRASILHDVHCDRHPHDGPERRAGDEMFYAACRAGGCGDRDAKLLLLGVRFGSLLAGRGTRGVEQGGAVRLSLSAEDRLMQEEFERLGRQLAAKDVASTSPQGLSGGRESPAAAVNQVDAVFADNRL